MLLGTLEDLGSRFPDRSEREGLDSRESFRDVISRLGDTSPQQEQELTSAAMDTLVRAGRPVSQSALMDEVSSLVEEIEADLARPGGGGAWEVAPSWRRRRGRDEGDGGTDSGDGDGDDDRGDEKVEDGGGGMFEDSDRTGAAFMDDIMMEVVAAREAQAMAREGEEPQREGDGE